jgi:DNA gyrase inhibitor GyrI
MKRLLLLLGAAVAGAVSYFFISNSRAATESAKYRVLHDEGNYQIRQYPALMVAGTSVSGTTSDQGFQRLFRFIQGANARERKISMTTPVLIDHPPEEGGQERMSFVMPAELKQEGVPEPDDDAVTITERRPQTVAVYRYQGKQSRANEHESLEKLRDWMRATNLQEAGTPVIAYYDPPWTPATLRRNEVLIPVKTPLPEGDWQPDKP